MKRAQRFMAILAMALITTSRLVSSAIAADAPDLSKTTISGSVSYAIEPPVGVSYPQVAMVEFRKDGASSASSQSFLVGRTANGTYEFTAECDFIGKGTLIIRDPAAPSGINLTNRGIDCIPTNGITPLASNEGRFSSLAAADAAPPVATFGEIQSWLTHRESTFTQTGTFIVNGQSQVNSDYDYHLRTTEYNGTQVCTLDRRDCRSCKGGNCTAFCCSSPLGPGGCAQTYAGSTVTSCRLKTTLPVHTDWLDVANSDPWTRTLANSVVQTYTGEISQLQMTWSFPGSAGSQYGQFDIFAVRPDGGEYVWVSDSAELRLGATGASNPGVRPTISPVPTACGEQMVTGGNAFWSFQDVNATSNVTFSLVPHLNHACSIDSSPVTAERINAGYAIRGTPPPEFRLESEQSVIAPSSRMVGFSGCQNISALNDLGDSSTTVRASISGRTPGSIYTAILSITTFDAAVSGHDHNTPALPDSLKGTLNGAAQQNTCNITVQSNGTGHCDLVYQAERVAGRVTLTGTVQQDPQLTDDLVIDIQSGGVGALPNDPTIYQLTGATAQHSVNHYGTESTLDRIRNIAAEYLARTGTRLGINDVSLVRGGIFDINGSWGPSHCSHKQGRDADIDQQVFHPQNSTEVGTITCGNDINLHIAVANAGSGAILACEGASRVNKHIDFP